MVSSGSSGLYSFSIGQAGLGKTNELASASGREGIISKDSIDFLFGFGDIKLNGQNVSFVERENEQRIYNIADLNSYLKTEPFLLTDTDQMEFGLYYAVTDSAAAVTNLTNDEYAEYSVRLIDESTGELLGEYVNLRLNRANIVSFGQDNFQIDPAGIGNKTVHLELKITTNIQDECALADIRSNEYIVYKSNYNRVAFNGEAPITNYELFQNYPNPFNPATTITYQIPKNDHVTVKVYDILGREVATLVNQFQKVGKYNVELNAANLASGVYLYSIQTTDFRDTKKMILMK